jgi:hypothetical protein
MKLILITFLLSSVCAHAQNRHFIKCLGQKEAFYHKNKISNAYQKLNARLISTFIQMPQTLSVKEKYQVEICSSQTRYPSMVLLKNIILKQDKLFKSFSDKNDITTKSLNKMAINDILKKAYNLFISLIDDLQAQSNKANCILNQVPELKRFYKQTRYTLEDQGLKKIIFEIKHLEKILLKFERNQISTKC